jgi:hypothetical protein
MSLRYKMKKYYKVEWLEQDDDYSKLRENIDRG